MSILIHPKLVPMSLNSSSSCANNTAILFEFDFHCRTQIRSFTLLLFNRLVTKMNTFKVGITFALMALEYLVAVHTSQHFFDTTESVGQASMMNTDYQLKNLLIRPKTVFNMKILLMMKMKMKELCIVLLMTLTKSIQMPKTNSKELLFYVTSVFVFSRLPTHDSKLNV